MNRSHRRGRRLAQVAALPLLAVVAVPLLVAAPASAAPSRDAAGSYLVRVRPDALAATAAQVRQAGGTVRSTLAPLSTLVVTLPAGRAGTVRTARGVVSVVPDVAGHLLEGVGTSTALGSDYDPAGDLGSMYNVEGAIGARALWGSGGTGSTGSGVDVALLDSGVDSTVAGLDAPGKVVQGPDLSFESQDDATRNRDTFGHGTHMAGIIAGRDAGATIDPNYDPSTTFLGVAPAARIVSVRVAGANGATDVSQVIAGISWVIEHAQDPGFNIRVLNLSFGTDNKSQGYVDDPLAYAAEQAWQHGIVVVTSAGNGGTNLGRLTDPAIDPYVLAVGASDYRNAALAGDDGVATFSGRGDGVRNPDLVAPGTHIQSLRAPGSTVDALGTAGQVGGRYQRGSGTSQAAAVTSGSVALLLAQRPGLTPDQVKAMLLNGTRPFFAVSAKAQGRGQLSVKRALAASAKPLQSFPPSTGTGSLEASRGSVWVTDGTTRLEGEQDIFGQAYDSAAMAKLIAAGSTWAGGTWNGSTWAGSTWAGSTWAGSTWAGSTWAGSTWAGSTWADLGWAGSTWAGSTWAGSTWAGAGWE